MVPTAFVLLDALPRTPNGKIDRNALPAPDRSRVEDAERARRRRRATSRSRSPRSGRTSSSLDAVGVETNLFDLGANSLMMVRASSRLGEALGRKVSLVEMFGYPTVRSLAAHLGGDGDGDEAALSQSQDRAEARREAMRRRQGARAGRRAMTGTRPRAVARRRDALRRRRRRGVRRRRRRGGERHHRCRP